MTQDDFTLLSRWHAHRDAEAFAELVGRHAGMVHAACKRVLGSRPGAEDVAQECFVALAQRPAPREHVAGWLYRSSVNRALDVLRAETRRLQREQAYSETLEASQTSPELEELLAQVDKALAALPDRLRTPLVLHFFEGQTHEALAGRLGITRSAVSYRIARGIDQLRKQLHRGGMTATVAALTTALAGARAGAAPPELASRLIKLALSGSTPSGTAVALGSVVWFKPGVVKLILALLIGGGVVYTLIPDRGAANTIGVAEAAPEPMPVVPSTPVTELPEDEASQQVKAYPPAIQAISEHKAPVVASNGARVYGHVRDISGQPVANLHVQTDRNVLDGGNGQIITDSSGYFDLRNLAPALEGRIYAETKGARTQQVVLYDLRAGEEHEVDLTLYRNTISGRVIDENGQPVAGVLVYAQPRDFMRGGIPGERADERGVFSITGFFPGIYDLKLDGEDGAPWQETGQSVEIVGPESADGLVLVLTADDACQFTGFVTTEEGMPIAEAMVTANLTSPPHSRSHARTDEEGRYCIAGLEPADYLMQVHHLDYGSAVRSSVPAHGGNVDFTLPPRGGISGQVLDAATRKPVPGFELLEYLPVSSSDPSMITENWRTVQDAAGRFSLENLEPHTFGVHVRAVGYADAHLAVDVLAGEVVDNVLVLLDRASEISGVVVDTAGEPVVGAAIYAGVLHSEHAREDAVCASTSADGSFKLGGCLGDATSISVRHHGYAPAVVSLPEKGQTLRVVLGDGASISGTVSLDGAPVARAPVTVLFITGSQGSTYLATTTERGAYAREKMPEGEAHVMVALPETGPYKRTQHAKAVLTSGDAKVQNFAFISWDTSLRGKVLRNGMPIPGISYLLRAASEVPLEELFEGTTSSEGAFSVEGIAPGTYELFLDASGGIEGRRSTIVTLVEGEELVQDFEWESE